MKIQSTLISNIFKTSLKTLILLLLISCGGGTIGTGGDNSLALSRVEGTITSQTSVPLSGVTVSIDGNADITVTENDGSFGLDIDNLDVLTLDEDTNQVLLDIRIGIDLPGQNDTFETSIAVSVDASESLAQIAITVDIPDGLIEAIEGLDDSETEALIDSLGDVDSIEGVDISSLL